MNDLIILFSQLQANDNDIIASATETIKQFEQNVDGLGLVIQVIASNSSDFVRLQAIICTKHMLELHWGKIYTIPEASSIRATLLNLIQNESNTHIQHLIVYAIEPICAFIREFPWPELDTLILALIESGNNVHLDIAFKLMAIIIPYMEELILDLIPKIAPNIESALNIDDPELICSAADLIANIIKLLGPPLPDYLEHLNNLLTQVFQNALSNASPYLNRLSNAIDMTVCENWVIPPNSQLQFLLTLASDENLDPQLMFFVFDPIASIVSTHFDEISKGPLFLDLLTILYQSTAKCFVDDCLEEQSDCEFIMGILLIIIEQTDNIELYNIIKEIIADDSINTQFASLLVLQQFIDESPSVAAGNLINFVTFIVNHSSESNHICVREESLVCIHHIINTVNGGLKDYVTPLLDSCIQALSSQEESIVNFGLTAITELLSTLPISSQYISNVMEILCNIATSGYLLESVINALSALTFSASDDIIPYINTLYDMFKEYAMVSEGSHPILKSASIKGLVHLILAAPNNLKDITSQIIQIMCDLSNKPDSSVSYCTLQAFTILAHAAIPELNNFISVPMNQVKLILLEDLPEEIGKTELEAYSSLFDLKTDGVKLLQYLIKNYSRSIDLDVNDIFETLSVLLQYEVTDLQVQAIKTLTQLCITYSLDPNEGLLELIEQFESEDSFVVGSLFKSFTKIINSNLEYGQGIISRVLAYANKGIIRELACQIEREFDIDLMMNLFGFMSSTALVYPNLWTGRPMDMFLKSLNKDPYVKALGTQVISSLIVSMGGAIPSLYMKSMIKAVNESMDKCDGTIQPVPLHSARLIFEKDPNLFNNIISRILELIDAIMEDVTQDQPAYSETMAASISFLFSLCRIAGGDYIQRCLPILLSQELINDPSEAQNIYESLLILISEYEGVIEPYFPQIYRALSLLFSMKSRDFQRLNLSDDLVIRMIQLFIDIQSKLPNPEEILSSVADRISTDRINALIAKYQS